MIVIECSGLHHTHPFSFPHTAAEAVKMVKKKERKRKRKGKRKRKKMAEAKKDT